jgi:hypothetical protein
VLYLLASPAGLALLAPLLPFCCCSVALPRSRCPPLATGVLAPLLYQLARADLGR